LGRLAGFRYRDIVRRLKALGFEFDRQAAGSHEIWYSASTRRYTTIPNHTGDMPEGTLRAVLKQAGIDPEQFLELSVPRARAVISRALATALRASS
jgi:predicted RNA binding protein YcfA (HicA-like mRNA interferase family)